MGANLGGNGDGNGHTPIKLGKKDYQSDQDVRWCPGCGDYAILAQVQKVFADLQIERDNTVFVSGIGFRQTMICMTFLYSWTLTCRQGSR